MQRINEASVVAPVAMFTLALFSSPHRALGEEELIHLVGQWYDLLKLAPYSSSMVIAQEDVKASLNYAEEVSAISRFSHPAGDVLHINEKDYDLLTYYKNNIIHLFVLPSLIASFFQNHDSACQEELIHSCRAFYPILKKEYFLRWSTEEIEQALRNHIRALVAKELLEWDEEQSKLLRPSLASAQSSYFIILGNIIGEQIKQYSLLICILYQDSLNRSITLEDYKKECSLLSRKLFILGSLRDSQNLNDTWYTDFIKFLTLHEYIKIKDNVIYRQEKLEDLSVASINFLGADTYQSIIRTTKKTHSKDS